MPLIKIEKASFSYGQQQIFADLNFVLGTGEIFCLFGPNGCGKTTLLENILGLLKLNQGSIFINNLNIANLKPAQLAKKMAYLPQFHNKTFPYKVKEIVLMGRAAYTPFFSAPSKEDKKKVDHVLKLIGIYHLRERPYLNLSGGESRLVMLARALVQEAQVIVMDEPTSHLDFRHELEILEIIVKLIKEKGLSIIMSTHFPNQAFYFENKGIKTTLGIMNNKKLLFQGSPEKVLTEKNMEEIFKIKTKILSYSEAENEKLKYLIPLKIIQEQKDEKK